MLPILAMVRKLTYLNTYIVEGSSAIMHFRGAGCKDNDDQMC